MAQHNKCKNYNVIQLPQRQDERQTHKLTDIKSSYLMRY